MLLAILAPHCPPYLMSNEIVITSGLCSRRHHNRDDDDRIRNVRTDKFLLKAGHSPCGKIGRIFEAALYDETKLSSKVRTEKNGATGMSGHIL